ncbi:MAG TPA: glycosyltransferase family 2 protein [Nitrospirae bacterium]|nr:glycosyltransferase family 2 protein [Nitrospirota bacterium]HDZ00588.1 glycosyltransferase family 2 protein [Nitrospirota bacterium]
MPGTIYNVKNQQWEVPEFQHLDFFKKRSNICVCTPVINEGQRIRTLLERMHGLHLMDTIDVLIADGGSSDGSLEEDYLRTMEVRTLLTKVGPGKLSSQMRMAMAYGVEEGYTGFVFIDGNNKDDPEAVPRFISKLEDGYDFVQGSRHMLGGRGVNTPHSRHYGVKYLHAPLISLAARRRFTDTTNGFRAYSTRLLLDPRVQPFREVFWSYEILFYLAIRASRLGFRVTEIPTTRAYPANEKTPTKISPVRGSFNLLKLLFRAVFVGYNP